MLTYVKNIKIRRTKSYFFNLLATQKRSLLFLPECQAAAGPGQSGRADGPTAAAEGFQLAT
jgi:hypothetical protein